MIKNKYLTAEMRTSSHYDRTQCTWGWSISDIISRFEIFKWKIALTNHDPKLPNSFWCSKLQLYLQSYDRLSLYVFVAYYLRSTASMPLTNFNQILFTAYWQNISHHLLGKFDDAINTDRKIANSWAWLVCYERYWTRRGDILHSKNISRRFVVGEALFHVFKLFQNRRTWFGGPSYPEQGMHGMQAPTFLWEEMPKTSLATIP